MSNLFIVTWNYIKVSYAQLNWDVGNLCSMSTPQTCSSNHYWTFFALLQSWKRPWKGVYGLKQCLGRWIWCLELPRLSDTLAPGCACDIKENAIHQIRPPPLVVQIWCSRTHCCCFRRWTGVSMGTQTRLQLFSPKPNKLYSVFWHLSIRTSINFFWQFELQWLICSFITLSVLPWTTFDRYWSLQTRNTPLEPFSNSLKSLHLLIFPVSNINFEDKMFICSLIHPTH